MVKRTNFPEPDKPEKKSSWDIDSIFFAIILGPMAFAIFLVVVRYLIDIVYYVFTTPLGRLVH